MALTLRVMTALRMPLGVTGFFGQAAGMFGRALRLLRVTRRMLFRMALRVFGGVMRALGVTMRGPLGVSGLGHAAGILRYRHGHRAGFPSVVELPPNEIEVAGVCQGWNRLVHAVPQTAVHLLQSHTGSERDAETTVCLGDRRKLDLQNILISTFATYMRIGHADCKSNFLTPQQPWFQTQNTLQVKPVLRLVGQLLHKNKHEHQRTRRKKQKTQIRKKEVNLLHANLLHLRLGQGVVGLVAQ